jgi:hypothetical protein
MSRTSPSPERWASFRLTFTKVEQQIIEIMAGEPLINGRKHDLPKLLNKSFTTLSVILFLPVIIWVAFIFMGYQKLGHLPTLGDPEVVSFEGFDRFLVITALYVYMFGGVIWFLLIIINFILKLREIRWKYFVIGATAIGLTILLTFTPQFSWLLD